MKSKWTRLYKSNDKPIYIYYNEDGYKVNAYSFYPRYFRGEDSFKNCLQYVSDFGDHVNIKEPHATV